MVKFPRFTFWRTVGGKIVAKVVVWWFDIDEGLSYFKFPCIATVWMEERSDKKDKMRNDSKYSECEKAHENGSTDQK